MNYKMVGFVLGRIFLIEAALMLFPMGCAAIYGEWSVALSFLWPALIVLALSLFPLPQIVLLTVAVAMASPTATMGTIFAIRYDRNAVYASELFAVTTILSAVSLPLVVFLAERLL